MPRLDVKVEHMDELLAKLRTGEPVYALPWRRALLALAKDVRARVQGRAPVGGGRLKAKTRYRVPKTPVPLYAVVTNSAARKGFRYGFALDAGGGIRHKSGRHFIYHHQGRETKGWFSGVLGQVQGMINATLNAAMREIESAWRT